MTKIFCDIADINLIKKFNKKKHETEVNFKKIKNFNDLKKLKTKDLFSYQIPLKSNDYLINILNNIRISF